MDLDRIFGQPGTSNPIGGSSPVGSASNGGLTEADQWALRNVFQEQAQVEPDDGGFASYNRLTD